MIDINLTWLITLASIIGTIANIFKKRWCFIIWLVTNSLWAVIDFCAGLYAQSFLFVICVILAIWGLWQWRKGEHKEVIGH